MEPKPAHLGREYSAQFKDTSTAKAYHHRPPYPAEVFHILFGLISDQPRVVLDVGCGTGDLARRLVTEVERVDAVDFSQAMLERGRTLPGGNDPHLNWIHGRVEEVEFQTPYALITAGESLHWMEWDTVLPLFHRTLSPHGYLAIVERSTQSAPWNDSLLTAIQHFSTNREYRPYNLIEELKRRHLFRQQGQRSTAPVEFIQPLDDYVESFHSRNGLSRNLMSVEAANSFGAEVRRIVEPFLKDGQVSQYIIGNVTWGTPQV